VSRQRAPPYNSSELFLQDFFFFKIFNPVRGCRLGIKEGVWLQRGVPRADEVQSLEHRLMNWPGQSPFTGTLWGFIVPYEKAIEGGGPSRKVRSGRLFC
jgi:hypothetical protein